MSEAEPPTDVLAACVERAALERHRLETVARLDQRRRTVMAKLDRGYDDFVSDKISEEFWTRKSQEWEAEVQVVDSERARLMQRDLARRQPLQRPT